MTRKCVFGTLAVIALLALSATGAEAGPGGSPSPLTSFFLCETINGDDAGTRFDVDSIDVATGAGWGIKLQNVRIGNATLGCRFARLFKAGSNPHITCAGLNQPEGCNEISPNPPQTFEDLKCYSVSIPRSTVTGVQPPAQPQSFTVFDNLFPTGVDPNVTSSSVQYVCAPASFSPNAQ